jgi:hypothetical protein
MDPGKARRPLLESLKTGFEDGIRHAKGEITLKTTVPEIPAPPSGVTANGLTKLRLTKQRCGESRFFARIRRNCSARPESRLQGRVNELWAGARFVPTEFAQAATILNVIDRGEICNRGIVVPTRFWCYGAFLSKAG